jgi:hypothetical protein
VQPSQPASGLSPAARYNPENEMKKKNKTASDDIDHERRKGKEVLKIYDGKMSSAFRDARSFFFQEFIL